MKKPWHERMKVARSGLWAPNQPLNYCVPELYSSFVAYMYINCSDNTEGEYKKRMNHFKKFPPKKTIRRIKTKSKTKEITKTQELKGKEHNASVINQDKKNLLFVCLFLFTFTRGVMKPWDQI